MNLLSIDTTSAIASVAVRSREGCLRKTHSEQKMSHLQNLVPMIERVLKQCELQIGDITHIAISEGPGSFTGIRIGAATAKMLAQALQIGLIPVPTLMAYAYRFREFGGVICPVLDARRSQVYAAAYEWRGGHCAEVVPGAAYPLEALLALTNQYERVLYIGDGAETHGLLPRDQTDAPGLAEYILQIAQERLEEGPAVSPATFRPVYMRQAEAIRKLEESRKEEGK